ncbi:hypothetical protein PCASD_22344 [Puccinia coronata f. sp. avenae]|uniref:Uncharacterized protein n=1 Tax=Puccinia coronata f. sp. avenae TaxID=200324 RepID=A0A2N5U8E9_9BASI|nr:hypothetical protein PCASD_22344 [Puccinia coronata f. sp. avenae]
MEKLRTSGDKSSVPGSHEKQLDSPEEGLKEEEDYREKEDQTVLGDLSEMVVTEEVSTTESAEDHHAPLARPNNKLVDIAEHAQLPSSSYSKVKLCPGTLPYHQPYEAGKYKRDSHAGLRTTHCDALRAEFGSALSYQVGPWAAPTGGQVPLLMLAAAPPTSPSPSPARFSANWPRKPGPSFDTVSKIYPMNFYD